MFTTTRPNDLSGPQTVLTIDDDRIVRTSIKLFLEDLGYLALEAENGQQGLDLIQNHHPHLVLLDLRMPGLSGLDILDRVKQQDSEIPVVVISGTGKISDVVSALHKGAWDFLLKPIDDLTVLQHTIEKALDQVRLQSENLEYQRSLEEKVSLRTAALEHAYNQLTVSERKYRSIFENLLDIYYEVDLEGTLLEVSPSVEKSSHYTREELLGTDIWRLYPDPEQRRRLLQKLQENGRVSDFEIQLQDKNGRLTHFSVNAMRHPQRTGQASYISGIMHDITERKETESRLRTSNQTLEALFNAAPLAILAIDAEMKITLWNRTAEEMFGWSAAEVLGRPYPLAPEGKQEEARENLLRAMRGEVFRGHEVVRQHKDGRQVTVNLFTAPLRNSDNRITGQIVILEDVSEIHKLRNETERSSRLASLGELAAGVAHEINNPNGLILLNLPTLKDFVSDAIAYQSQLSAAGELHRFAGFSPDRAAEAFPRLLGEIEDSSRRIKQIVEDLKNFARQDNIEYPEWFDLNQSVEKALRLTANNLKKATYRFTTDLASDLPPVNGTPQRIEQVIVNLLVNACEALTDGEQGIHLKTAYDQASDLVCLSVSDQGCGISSEQLTHITDPFFTTRREQGGTGLGLSVSARIIKEHHGKLEFSSQPGYGTVASFSLPVKAIRS